ncbi:carbohydrate kinase family protein [Streptomyces griseoruber]
MTALIIGEALVDVVWPAGSTHLTPHPGGSPANVAVGLRRLGRPVTLMTCWGDDPPGELVRVHLDTIGIEVHRLPSDSERTTIALAYLDQATGAARYDFLPTWDPARIPIDPDTTLLHTGSLASVVEPGASRVAAACRDLCNRGGTVSVDLNVRPAVLPDRDAYRKQASRLAEVADVVKASDEDLAWLYPGLPPHTAARTLLGLGPSLIVVTQGAAGAFAMTAHHHVTVTAPQVDVVDTIGAGDAFQATLLDSLMGPDGIHLPATPEELVTLLRRCTVAGALACTRRGAQPPTREEIEATLVSSPGSV